MQCFKCGFEIELTDKVYRQETCPKCASWVHCCYNCRFYDPLAYHQCREPEARFVKEKDIANFCNYFEPRSGPFKGDASKADEARRKLEELFKKKDVDEEEA